MLCKCCSLIDFQLIFNYGEDFPSIRDGCPHHANLTKLIKSASAGCDLCSLFLKTAEDYAQDSFESIEACGQLYIRSLTGPGVVHVGGEITRLKRRKLVDTFRRLFGNLESVNSGKNPERIFCVVDVYSHQSKGEHISLFRVIWRAD
jgi:hypothetical protein